MDKFEIFEWILRIPIVLLSLTIHEVAHGYAAYKLGDPTAKNFGRLSLNPLKHLDPIGALCMLVFRFGWAKPVPINTRNFRNSKRGMALSALAGPLANAILGLISAALLGFTTALYYHLAFSGASDFILTCISYTTILFELSAIYNLLFMAFNLIPIPPFDGSRIALVFLPPKAYFGIMRYERQIMIGLLVTLMLLSRLGFSPFSWIAYNLTDLVANPVFELFGKLFGFLA